MQKTNNLDFRKISSTAQRKKSLLIVCEFGQAEDNSTGHLVSEIPKLLEASECDIIDITNMPNFFVSLYNFVSKYKIIRTGKKFVACLGLMASMRSQRNNYDHILIISNPFLSLLVPPSIWKGSENKLGYLLLDLFPENLEATRLSIPKWVSTALKHVRNKNLKKADTVFAIGVDMEKYLSEVINIHETVSYTPLWIGDTEFIEDAGGKPVDNTDPSKSDNSLKLHFFGNIGMVQDLSRVFEIVEKNSHFSLDVFGGGAKSNYYKDRKGERIRFHGPVPFTQREKIFHSGIVGVVPQQLTLVGLAVPSKAFYYWSRGYPILFLGSLESELGRLITAHPYLGLVLEPDANPNELTEDLDQISKYPQSKKIISQCQQLREKAQHAFQQRLS